MGLAAVVLLQAVVAVFLILAEEVIMHLDRMDRVIYKVVSVDPEIQSVTSAVLAAGVAV
jgi:hypothetical protein